MVTFSTRDSHKELDKKFKVKREDKDTVVISWEEFNELREQMSIVCQECGTTLEYNSIDDSYWCNTCVRYIQPKDVKRRVDFEIPQSARDVEPTVTCIDSPGFNDVSVKKKVEYKGGFKVLSQKGTIRIKDYNESVG